MDIKELDRLAKLNEPLPKNLPFYEEAYFITSRSLYRQYDKKEITLEQAKAEKQRVVEAYKENKEMYNFLFSLHAVEAKLLQLKEQGFNTALELEILEIIEKLHIEGEKQ